MINTKVTTDSTRGRLISNLELLIEPLGRVLKIRKGDNSGPLIGRLFVWQETTHYAQERLKEAWKEAYDEGLISGDDKLRETIGTRIAAESAQFLIITEVATARRNFKLDRFIGDVAAKFKIKPSELYAMAETCKERGTNPLTKTVVEATDSSV